MNALARRLAALERATVREPARCAVCGGPDPRRAVLTFEGDRPLGPERCPSCGRRLVYRLDFDRQG